MKKCIDGLSHNFKPRYDHVFQNTASDNILDIIHDMRSDGANQSECENYIDSLKVHKYKFDVCKKCGITTEDSEKEIRKELDTALDHFNHYTDSIDKALGEPRDLVEGPILDEHLEAIRRLRNGECTYLLSTIAYIRQELGVYEKPMLSELPNIVRELVEEKNALKYELKKIKSRLSCDEPTEI